MTFKSSQEPGNYVSAPVGYRTSAILFIGNRASGGEHESIETLNEALVKNGFKKLNIIQSLLVKIGIDQSVSKSR
jgi:hypothetical protein